MVTLLYEEEYACDATSLIGERAINIYVIAEYMTILQGLNTLPKSPSNHLLNCIFTSVACSFKKELIDSSFIDGQAIEAIPCGICKVNKATTVAGFPILHCSDPHFSPAFVDYAAVPHCNSSLCIHEAGAHVAKIGSQRLERKYHCAYCRCGFGPKNRLRQCNECSTARYCSDDCASAHRVDHGSVCDYIQRRRRNEGAEFQCNHFCAPISDGLDKQKVEQG